MKKTRWAAGGDTFPTIHIKLGEVHTASTNDVAETELKATRAVFMTPAVVLGIQYENAAACTSSAIAILALKL